MREIFQSLGMVVTGIFAVRFAVLALRLWRGDSSEYNQNRRRAGTPMATLKGQLSTEFDGARDYRVAAGIAIDRKKNEWVEQGRLSIEAVSAVLSRSSHS